MMNMIEQLLGNQLAPLLGRLENLGLNPKQAKDFLSEGGQQTMAALQEEGARTDLATKPEQYLVSSLLGKIDTQALAAKIGISGDLADRALQNILPSLVHAFSNTSALGNLEGLLKKGQGGMADTLKSGLGKLFS